AARGRFSILRQLEPRSGWPYKSLPRSSSFLADFLRGLLGDFPRLPDRLLPRLHAFVNRPCGGLCGASYRGPGSIDDWLRRFVDRLGGLVEGGLDRPCGSLGGAERAVEHLLAYLEEVRGRALDRISRHF